MGKDYIVKIAGLCAGIAIAEAGWGGWRLHMKKLSVALALGAVTLAGCRRVPRHPSNPKPAASANPSATTPAPVTADSFAKPAAPAEADGSRCSRGTHCEARRSCA